MGKPVCWFDEIDQVVLRMWNDHTPDEIADVVNVIIPQRKPKTVHGIGWQTTGGGVIYTAERLGLINSQQRQEMLDKRYEDYQKMRRKMRGTIPRSVKRAVFQRDEGKCCACGKADKIEYHHIRPVINGGRNDTDNIQLLCERCHRNVKTWEERFCSVLTRASTLTP